MKASAQQIEFYAAFFLAMVFVAYNFNLDLFHTDNRIGLNDSDRIFHFFWLNFLNAADLSAKWLLFLLLKFFRKA